MSYRQSNKAYAAGTSVSAGFTANPSQGNLVVAMISHYGTGLEPGATCYDSQNGIGSPWTQVSSREQHASDISFHMKAWYAYVPNANQAMTVTVSFAGTDYTSLAIFELAGITASNPVDVFDFNQGTGTAPSAGSITTTAADIVIAMCGDEYNSGTATTTPDTDVADWTQLQEYENGTTEMRINAMYRIAPSGVTDTADWTIANSANWIGLVVAFKKDAALPAGRAEIVARTKYFNAGGGGTSAPINTTGANLLVILLAASSTPGAVLPTDSYNNTWQALTLQGPGGSYVRIFYSYSPTVGANHTFTTPSNGTYWPTMMVYALAGMASGSGVFDAENGSATNVTGNITPAQVNEFLFSVSVASAGGPYSPSSGWTSDYNQPYSAGVNIGAAAADINGYNSQNAIGCTWPVSSGDASAIVAFKIASASSVSLAALAKRSNHLIGSGCHVS